MRNLRAQEWCLLCGRGNFSLSGAAACSRCAAGRAANLVGASACEECAAGRYTWRGDGEISWDFMGISWGFTLW